MKFKHYFWGLICFITLNANSQSLMPNDTSGLKKGIYKNYDEFKHNNPSLPLNFSLISFSETYGFFDANSINRYRLLGLSQERDSIWGFCDGENVYVNYSYYEDILFSKGLTFDKLVLGRYCYAECISYFYGGGTIGRLLIRFAIDFNTGQAIRLNNNGVIKKLLKNDPELLQQFKNDDDKRDRYSYYLQEYSKRHKNEIIK